MKDKRIRQPRHEIWGVRQCVIELQTHKWRCLACGRYFWQRFPGILARKRATEPFRRSVFLKHWDGISRSRLGQRESIASATVERWSQDFLKRHVAERSSAVCPRILGIDEHFFTRRLGYATTFCDLKGHTVFDVVLGRSEAALESYLNRLQGKDKVLIVCMVLASVYRSLVRKHFPNARIVADRFHVIRLINHHFLACWRELDPAGARNRGLLSLMRRHRHNLKPEPTGPIGGISGSASSHRCDLPLQTRALLSPSEETPYQETVRTLSPTSHQRHSPTARSSTATTGHTRRYIAFLVIGDRHHVALHQEQCHHRRFSHQNGSPLAAGIWFSQLPKLQAQG